ncbi:MAG: 2-hydroxychromene-2-carboxylate isomerase [Deltaproteobacteria bacterium]|nr:2-hydroxychromene-2-carboxylate isomerase [Deltaproteobacteria bacterium]
MAKVEFFYDYSSPWTYLAFTRIEELCRRRHAELEWRPVLVGGIFNTVNPSVYESRERPVPPKARYLAKDLRDWAEFYRLEIRFPPSVFPVNSVKALRGALVALERGRISPYSQAVFAAYWGDDQDISRDDVLEPIVRRAGLDPAEYFAKIQQPAYKDRVRANTEECVRRGGFGSPTMFVGDSMFFGNDRLILVEHALAGKSAR